jgi:hypothetical protein
MKTLTAIIIPALHSTALPQVDVPSTATILQSVGPCLDVLFFVLLCLILTPAKDHERWFKIRRLATYAAGATLMAMAICRLLGGPGPAADARHIGLSMFLVPALARMAWRTSLLAKRDIQQWILRLLTDKEASRWRALWRAFRHVSLLIFGLSASLGAYLALTILGLEIAPPQLATTLLLGSLVFVETMTLYLRLCDDSLVGKFPPLAHTVYEARTLGLIVLSTSWLFLPDTAWVVTAVATNMYVVATFLSGIPEDLESEPASSRLSKQVARCLSRVRQQRVTVRGPKRSV